MNHCQNFVGVFWRVYGSILGDSTTRYLRPAATPPRTKRRMKKTRFVVDPPVSDPNPIAPHRRRDKPAPTVLCVIDTVDISLEAGAPPQERRHQHGKDKKNDILEHCEPPFSRQVASLNGMNDERCRPAVLTLCLAPVSKRVGSRTLNRCSNSPRKKIAALTANLRDLNVLLFCGC